MTTTTERTPQQEEDTRNERLEGLDRYFIDGDLSGFDVFLDSIQEQADENPQDLIWKLQRYSTAIRGIRSSWDEDRDKSANALTLALFEEVIGVQDELLENHDVSDTIGFYHYSMGLLEVDLMENIIDSNIAENDRQLYLELLVTSTALKNDKLWVYSDTIQELIRPVEVVVDGHTGFINGADEKEIEKYNEYILSPEFLESGLRVLDDMYKDGEAWRVGRVFKDYMFGQLGIQGEEEVARFSDAWSDTFRTPHYAANLELIGQLESVRPGAFRLLHEEYGITAFHRYKIDNLVNQYDEHGKTDKPYGIVVSAISDWNGALKEGGIGVHPVSDLTKASNGRQYIRIIETGGPIELARRFLSLDKLYGDKHKVSFASIQAHGEPDSIIFGESRPFGESVTKLTKSANYKSAKELFIPNPVILLDSCSTGKDKDSIAQQVSESLQATVYAPTAPAGAYRYNAEFDDKNRLQVSPSYGHRKDPENPFSELVEVAGSVFENGKLVRKTGGLLDR